MRRVRRDESGVVLVLSAIALVVMLGIAALVVDLGVSYTHRRQMQNSADAAALGGAQDLATGTTADATSDAEKIGNENLPNATLNWDGCTESPPAGFTAETGNRCIAFDSSFENISVRVPRQTFPSLFAGIFGIKSLSTTTHAVAGIHGEGDTAVLPFTLFLNFGNGEACLDEGSNANNAPPPCNGPTAGNFNSLDFHHYGNAQLGTTTDSPVPCDNSGNQLQRLEDNLAMGADHLYSDDPTNTIPPVNDNCINAKPNQVSQGTGNSTGFDDGMLSGSAFSDGLPARLQRVPSGFPGWETTGVDGFTVDNRPFWEFIPEQTISGVPNSCQRATFDTLLAVTPLPQQTVTMHAAIDRCLFEYSCGKVDLTPTGVSPAPGPYNCADPLRAGLPLPECGGAPCTAPLLIANTQVEPDLDVYDIQLSPRFAYVPQVWQTDVCPGNSSVYCYHIKVFRAVFMQRLLANNSKQLDFEPGPWNPANQGNHAAEAMTGFVLPPAMLPDCLGAGPPTADCPNTDPVQIGKNATIRLIQ